MVFQIVLLLAGICLGTHVSGYRPSKTTLSTSLESLLKPMETNNQNTDCNECIINIPNGNYHGSGIRLSESKMLLYSTEEPTILGQKSSVISILETNQQMSRRNDRISAQTSIFIMCNVSIKLQNLGIDILPKSKTQNVGKDMSAADCHCAVVSRSLLTVSDCSFRIGHSSSIFAVTSENTDFSPTGTAISVERCSMDAPSGLFAGFVKICSDIKQNDAVEVSIRSCSFSSLSVSDSDGMGLSLAELQGRPDDQPNLSCVASSLNLFNMSSVLNADSSHQQHLKQKMAGCVSVRGMWDLCGTCVRDVHNGGSLLCVNSSFLSSQTTVLTRRYSNNEGKVTIGSIEHDFDPSIHSSFTSSSPSSDQKIKFWKCSFTAADVPSSEHALSFDAFPAPIELESCTFTQATDDPTHTGWTEGCVIVKPSSFLDFSCSHTAYTGCTSTLDGGALRISSSDSPSSTQSLTLNKVNFTNCVAKSCGAVYILTTIMSTHIDNCIIERCRSSSTNPGALLFQAKGEDLRLTNTRFEECECSSDYGAGRVTLSPHSDDSVTEILIEQCQFLSCSSNGECGGLSVSDSINSSGRTNTKCEIIACLFEECSAAYRSGLLVSTYAPALVTDCLFKRCRGYFGSALTVTVNENVASVFSNIQIVNCSSSGSFLLMTRASPSRISFQKIHFANDDPSMDKEAPPALLYPTCHILFMGRGYDTIPGEVSFANCFTTGGSPIAMKEVGKDNGSPICKPYEAVIGPFLSKSVECVADETGKIKLRMEASFPNVEQKCEMNVEDDGGKQVSIVFQMNGGIGEGEEVVGEDTTTLQYSTRYTVTSLLVIAEDSNEQPSQTNADFAIHKAAWKFDLSATPDFLSFTTPAKPELPPLVPEDKDNKTATITLSGTGQLSGSFDCVVADKENTKTTISITADTLGDSFFGTSHDIQVAGNATVLKNGETYSVISLTKHESNPAEEITVKVKEGLSFSIPKSNYVEGKSMTKEMKRLMSWLIPVVLSLFLCLLIAIVVIVIVLRRKKESDVKLKEMEEQSNDDQIQVKGEELLDSNGIDQMSQSGNLPAFTSEKTFNNSQNHSNQRSTHERKGVIEVLTCENKCEIKTIESPTTLYTLIHDDQSGFEKKRVMQQLVKGIEALVQMKTEIDFPRHLSPYTIFIDRLNNVFLQLNFENNQASVHPDPQLSDQPLSATVAAKKDSPHQRWQAPEVFSEQASIDHSAASVFSLGLILWEIETGQVPFGEVDAVTACRQMKLGVVPPMDKVADSSFSELILRCLSVDPSKRPSLVELSSFLETHTFIEDTVTSKRAEMCPP
ncbi:hypothetical protein BLNAU_22296 [Blattamonas nauphoetae]|uniref:Protein kinase domain-containing protein n=1 Tax=Blattamonas nauphoetae TaxID=2049346 RepID=A0ABQ9WTY2_9EUKA|nr:hypothetical protein BLNAU_22296 [Blattamonas nauphoetae]